MQLGNEQSDSMLFLIDVGTGENPRQNSVDQSGGDPLCCCHGRSVCDTLSRKPAWQIDVILSLTRGRLGKGTEAAGRGSGGEGPQQAQWGGGVGFRGGGGGLGGGGREGWRGREGGQGFWLEAWAQRLGSGLA